MTYCVAINAELLISVCPLKQGGCMWQHRKTHHCKYTSEDLTTEEFEALVDAPKYDTVKVHKQIAQEVQK